MGVLFQNENMSSGFLFFFFLQLQVQWQLHSQNTKGNLNTLSGDGNITITSMEISFWNKSITLKNRFKYLTRYQDMKYPNHPSNPHPIKIKNKY
jgi:hypothetical protein